MSMHLLETLFSKRSDLHSVTPCPLILSRNDLSLSLSLSKRPLSRNDLSLSLSPSLSVSLSKRPLSRNDLSLETTSLSLSKRPQRPLSLNSRDHSFCVCPLCDWYVQAQKHAGVCGGVLIDCDDGVLQALHERRDALEEGEEEEWDDEE